MLKEAKIDSPELSAELIISNVLDTSRLEVLISPQKKVSLKDFKKIVSFVKRRSRGEPIAYIIGEKEFYGRPFKVNKDVLIPRPETELIIDLTKKFFQKKEKFSFLDIGTGSGNIAVTLVKEFPNSKGIATDISKNALIIAKKNIAYLKAEESLTLVCTDIVKGLKNNIFDLVVSNPPYIGKKDFPYLSREIKCFEPYSSLVGGNNGWEIYKKLFNSLQGVLKCSGIILIEIDKNIKNRIKEILLSQGVWTDINFFKDLTGNDRVVFARRSNNL